MFERLRNLFAAPEPAGDVLALERELQSLRMEVAEREQEVARLRTELERQRDGASARVKESVTVELEGLLGDLSAPVAQLLTQAYLLEQAGRPVQARDVLAVARRMVRALEDRGLTVEGTVGEHVPFDLNRHNPLSAGSAFRPGEPVVVRLVGISYRGRVLQKAGVDRDAWQDD